MSDSNPPVHMPDHEPAPRRRNGGEVPPPRVRMPDGFGAPRSLAGVGKPRERRGAKHGGWEW